MRKRRLRKVAKEHKVSMRWGSMMYEMVLTDLASLEDSMMRWIRRM